MSTVKWLFSVIDSLSLCVIGLGLCFLINVSTLVNQVKGLKRQREFINTYVRTSVYLLMYLSKYRDRKAHNKSFWCYGQTNVLLVLIDLKRSYCCSSVQSYMQLLSNNDKLINPWPSSPQLTQCHQWSGISDEYPTTSKQNITKREL